MIVSLPMNNASTMIAIDQPGITASASSSGGVTATMLPMNGTNRISAASMPQSSGLGSPMIHSAVPRKVPNEAFRLIWNRK